MGPKLAKRRPSTSSHLSSEAGSARPGAAFSFCPAPNPPASLPALNRHSQLAVIGGGPAGLRAAEVAAAAGLQVTLYDAKPSVGRKFLVAGRGGLNLTHGEAPERFVTRYSGPDQSPELWPRLLAGFDPAALRQWAADLGIETFQATTGRVYPREMKAAPLLRRWVARLKSLGVDFAMNHRWTDLVPGRPHRLGFASGEEATADAIVFALGGGSWGETGSDGAWTDPFARLGVAVRPLVAANCGWEHPWSADVLAVAEGQPLKNVHVRAGDRVAIGELLVTRYGLEGGALYQLGAALRAQAQPTIAIDFKPSFTADQLVAKMRDVKRQLLREAGVRWKLSPAALAILGRQPWTDVAALARETKHCVLPLTGPRPIAEAISSAGGVAWPELTEDLMVRRCPGVFLAGEMIDWEAPTGGYLMQGCFATGTHAARSAVAWIRSSPDKVLASK